MTCRTARQAGRANEHWPVRAVRAAAEYVPRIDDPGHAPSPPHPRGWRPCGAPPKSCTQQSVTVPPTAGAKFHQELVFESPEWDFAYHSLRNTNEGMNGYVKDPAHEALDDPGRDASTGWRPRACPWPCSSWRPTSVKSGRPWGRELWKARASPVGLVGARPRPSRIGARRRPRQLTRRTLILR